MWLKIIFTVITTYINPVYQYGIEKFIADLKNTSVKGVIIPDLPHEHENMVKNHILLCLCHSLV